MPLATLHAKFNEAIVRMGLGSAYRISPAEREAIEAELSVKTSELLRLLMERARHGARPPVSSFPVGAAGLGTSGTVYLGVNLEFGGAALNATVHAEQFVIANAMAAGEVRLLEISTSSAPCGHCRQFLNELPQADALICHIGSTVRTTLSALLPFAFGPADLFADADTCAHTHLLSGRQLALRLCDGDGDGDGGGDDDGDGDGEAVSADMDAGTRELRRAALAACRRAYSPYSGRPAGIAVRTRGPRGKVYTGWAIENAAYNPTLGPLQCALVALTVDGIAFSQIESAVLVQCAPKPAPAVSACLIPVTRALLATIAPRASLALYRACALPGIEADPSRAPRPARDAVALLATPLQLQTRSQPSVETPPVLDLQTCGKALSSARGGVAAEWPSLDLDCGAAGTAAGTGHAKPPCSPRRTRDVERGCPPKAKRLCVAGK